MWARFLSSVSSTNNSAKERACEIVKLFYNHYLLTDKIIDVITISWYVVYHVAYKVQVWKKLPSLVVCLKNEKRICVLLTKLYSLFL